MKSDERHQSGNGIASDGEANAEREIWLITAQKCVREKAGNLLASLPARLRVIEWKFGDASPCSDLAGSEKPALVVLDVCRDMNAGLQGIQQIRRHCGNIPLVVLTQEVSRAFGEKIISQGVAYYFTHEFPPEEFLDVTQNLLGLKRRQQAVEK